MEGLAEPGSTYVTGDTFRLTEGLFRFEGLGKKEIKGKADLVEVYRVLAASGRRTRFDVAAERGLTPFVGRERELELLLDALERAKDGRGQAVSIVAPAGDGKSRTLYEFRKGVANEDVTFLEGKCLSYSRSVSYHPVIDILKGNFDIREGDGDENIRGKVERGLQVLGADDAETTPYLLELLSVKESGIDLTLSPEARKERTIQALIRIVLKGSEIRPLILSVEDLHWMDRSSEEVFKDLLEHIAGARVLLLFTYRTEYVHTWGGRSYHSQITLNRLPNRETLAMVTHLLGTEHVAANLADLILEKTEGVPFFVEEFVKSLRDLQIIETRDHGYVLTKDPGDATIPSTIQDIIMARVDALPEGAKEVLQTGSVIEREFPHELIQAVTGLPEKELLPLLSALKDAELLYERGVYPHSTYIFKHALTREVVSDSILGKKRKQLHEAAGVALENLYGENLDEHSAALARHFIASENYLKGAEYSKWAAAKAMKEASVNDAIAWAEERIACLDNLPAREDVGKKIIEARTTVGLYYLQLSQLVEARHAIEPIINLAVDTREMKRTAQIYIILGTYYDLCEDNFDMSFKYFQEALDISKQLNDANSLYWANYWFAVSLSHDCQFDKSESHLKSAIQISSARGNNSGISIMKGMLGNWAYCAQGKAGLGYRTTQEAITVAEEAGDTYTKSMTYSCHGASCFGIGFLQEAIEYSRKTVDPFERFGIFYPNAVTHESLAQSFFELGEYDKSEQCYRKSAEVCESRKLFPYWRTLHELGAIKAGVRANGGDVDLERLKGFDRINRVKLYSGAFKRHLAELLLSYNDHRVDEAEHWITKAIESDRTNGLRLGVAHDLALYAEWFEHKGDKPRARASLGKAIEVFQECGADGWVKRTKEKLTQS
jgi:tetratricopeptide (TPR) repeat protein